MKSKSPAFQFYAAEFLADENVVLMSNQEIGCYIKLLCYCWREGSIPADVNKIARLCGEDSSAMAQLWQAIWPCFAHDEADPNRLINKRLQEERQKQEEHRKERAESGAKGAKARWGAGSRVGSKAIAKPLAEPMANDGSSSSTSNISTSLRSVDKPKKTAARKTLLPDDFVPCEAAVETLRAAGISVQAEIQKFRDHAKANGKTQADWQATFRTWARNAVDWKKPQAPSQQPQPKFKTAADKQREQANRMFGGLTNGRGREIDVSEDGAEWDRPALSYAGDDLR